MTKNSLMIKKLVGIATLTALVVVLQLLSNYIQFGSVSITLALIPMVVGAIIYGPWIGAFLGAVMGGIILTAPSTSTFLDHNVVATIFLCILKTGVAGLVSGYLYKLLMKCNFLKKAKFPVAIIVATLVAPAINTGLFILGTAIMYQGLSVTGADGTVIELVPSSGGFGKAFSAAVSFVVFTNFLIEFVVCAILSPAIVYLGKVLANRFDLGYSKDFKAAAGLLDIDYYVEEETTNSEESE